MARNWEGNAWVALALPKILMSLTTARCPSQVNLLTNGSDRPPVFSSRRRHTRYPLVLEFRRVLFRSLLISTPGRAEMVRNLARGLAVAGVFDRAVMHTPLAVVEAAREEAKKVNADCCVTVGGGSTIGFGKAIALASSLPVVAVPTTYSGSEMTTILGVSEGGAKKTGRDPKVVPKAVIYDPELTLDLPVAVSAASGMNAIAHCAEALYAHDGNPIVSLMAEEGIRALASALPGITSHPQNLEARSEALNGAWLAGMTISTTSVALHHKLCHVLGGFGLPHAETHSIVLPHAMRYNRDAAPEAMVRIRNALNTSDRS